MVAVNGAARVTYATFRIRFESDGTIEGPPTTLSLSVLNGVSVVVSVAVGVVSVAVFVVEVTVVSVAVWVVSVAVFVVEVKVVGRSGSNMA
jgi:hypothetical protein